MDSSTSPESSVAPVTGPVHSKLKKAILLCLFCFAQFLDTFNVSSVYAGIPSLEAVMGITANEAPWIVAAFQLTFAAFLLVVSRLCITQPRPALTFSKEWQDQ